MRFDNAKQANKASVCALCRLGMEMLTMKDLHPERCEFCDVSVDDLLAAAEAYVESPEGRLELAAQDIFEINKASEKKQELWGF